MSTAHANALVSDYLRRLDRAAAPLPRSRRTELVAAIREHIDDALLEADASDEVTVRNVLERLGPPEEIAAAAEPSRRDAGRLELAATILIAVPLVGWVLGVALVAFSRAWTNREKLTGIAICLVPVLAFGLGLAVAGSDSAGSTAVPLEPLPQEEVSMSNGDGALGPIELVVMLGTLLAGPFAAVYLGTRLRGRPERRRLESA
jgi:uncharacterized membrane protein